MQPPPGFALTPNLVRWRGHAAAPADDERLRERRAVHCRDKVAEYDAAAPRRRAVRHRPPSESVDATPSLPAAAAAARSRHRPQASPNFELFPLWPRAPPYWACPGPEAVLLTLRWPPSLPAAAQPSARPVPALRSAAPLRRRPPPLRHLLPPRRWWSPSRSGRHPSTPPRVAMGPALLGRPLTVLYH